jgi:hypothetical protein
MREVRLWWALVVCAVALSGCGGPRRTTETTSSRDRTDTDGETDGRAEHAAGDDSPGGETPPPDCRPVEAPSPTATTNVAWDRDDSTDCPAGGGTAHLLLPAGAGADLQACAAVERLQPGADPAGYSREDYTTVVLAGEGSEERRSFLVRPPDGGGLPFGLGDVLSVRIGVRQIRIHQIVHGTIADAAGRLLLAVSGDGDPSWAPGWRLELLEVAKTQAPTNPGGAERREHVVGLSTRGRVARVVPQACRQLEVDGARWWIMAAAIRYGEGTRLPDSSEYVQYELLRAAPPPAGDGPAVGQDPADEWGREPSVPDPSARMESGFFLADGAPDPLACATDADCLGDTVPAPGGCCQNPLDLRTYSQAYRTWLARWRPAHCADVTCPEPPAASPPGDCYFRVHCTTEGTCANSCRF